MFEIVILKSKKMETILLIHFEQHHLIVFEYCYERGGKILFLDKCFLRQKECEEIGFYPWIGENKSGWDKMTLTGPLFQYPKYTISHDSNFDYDEHRDTEHVPTKDDPKFLYISRCDAGTMDHLPLVKVNGLTITCLNEDREFVVQSQFKKNNYLISERRIQPMSFISETGCYGERYSLSSLDRYVIFYKEKVASMTHRSVDDRFYQLMFIDIKDDVFYIVFRGRPDRDPWYGLYTVKVGSHVYRFVEEIRLRYIGVPKGRTITSFHLYSKDQVMYMVSGQHKKIVYLLERYTFKCQNIFDLTHYSWGRCSVLKTMPVVLPMRARLFALINEFSLVHEHLIDEILKDTEFILSKFTKNLELSSRNV